MSNTTYPYTLFLERDKPLGSAFLFIENALEQFRQFAERHPERMDATLADAMDHVAAAHSALDSDFYTEREAKT